MDRATIDAYESGARAYSMRRRAYHPERAAHFSTTVPSGGLRLDVGCGPGHYLAHLGEPVVAADASVAMVVEARDRTPVPGIVCDLERLPFRRAAFAGVWASKCLQHVEAEALPLTLAGLHRVLQVDGVLDITLFAGTGVEVTGSDDDLPGRRFTLWQADELCRLLAGAGFEVDSVELHDRTGDHARLTVAARRARTLADTVGPGMDLLVCGLNPSLHAADAGVGFARPGNRFWPAAQAAGLLQVERDATAALLTHRIGMTDLVKRATARASELSVSEYRQGLDRVEWLIRWLRPRAVCFVGLAGWRAAVDRRARPGTQSQRLGGAPTYVMPSTSGLNASSSLAELTEHLRAAHRLARLTQRGPGPRWPAAGRSRTAAAR